MGDGRFLLELFYQRYNDETYDTQMQYQELPSQSEHIFFDLVNYFNTVPKPSFDASTDNVKGSLLS